MSERDTPVKDEVHNRAWHALAPAEVLRLLSTDPERGLGARDVEQRRARFGDNELPQPRRDTVVKVFLRQFRDPLIYILLVAGAVSLFIGRFDDAGFIFAVLLINASLGGYQEYRAESAAQALQRMMRIVAQVRRDGRTETVDRARSWCPGTWSW